MVNSAYLFNLFIHFAAANCKTTFLGLKPWYYYLQLDVNCNVINFTVLDPGHASSFILIMLALVDDLLILAGLFAVLYIVLAGVKYTTSQGDPGATARTISSLVNAFLGLGISIIAVHFVAFIADRLSGNAPGGGVTALGIDLGPLPFTSGADTGGVIQTMLDIVFALAGAISFIYLVIAGFRYVVARGDPGALAKAKNSILYAILGLVIAIMAQSVVSFVVGRL